MLLRIKAALVAALVVAVPLVAVPASAANPVDPNPVPQKGHLSGSPRSGLQAAAPYLNHTFAANTYTGLAAHVKVTQVPDATQGFFFSHSWQVSGIAGQGGYVGLQTQMFYGAGTFTRPGLIFSEWGATGCAPSAAGGLCFDFNETTPGKSIHYPFAWIVGREYSISVMLGFDGAGNRTASAFLVDTVSHGQVNIGTLTFPASHGSFAANGTSEWIEHYNPPASYPACSSIPITKDELSWIQLSDPNLNWANPTSTTPTVQQGQGCLNSGAVHVGGTGDVWRQVVGALS